MPAFDAYMMVDWSAAAVPRSGSDSIWYVEYRRHGGRLERRALANPTTRAAAVAELADRLASHLDQGRRVLVGFDFPFGYPAGTARALGLGGASPWAATWRLLADGLEDGPANANNRFALAESLNRRFSGADFPFWGCPATQSRPALSPRRPRRHRPGEPAERRLCERRVRRAQPVWKLAYAGSVGSQALTGIPRVRALRRDPRLAGAARVWPLETGLRDDPQARIVLAEIYPSLYPADRIEGMPKDAGQVTATARTLGILDRDGRLAPLFAGDPRMDAAGRRAVETEEAWILGAGVEGAR